VTRPASLFAVLVGFVACQSAPADLREWRPGDHDHTENPGAAQVDVKDGGNSQMAALGLNEVTLVAWKQNCVSCHGLIGRGDGPRGPAVKARDLSDPAWQASITDEQIALSIKNGRGQMQAFDLPESTIQGLVKLVRLLNPARTRDGGPSDAADVDATTDAKAPKKAPAPKDGGGGD
jgi:cytochrome c oxidase cbb3-type subunit 3